MEEHLVGSFIWFSKKRRFGDFHTLNGESVILHLEDYDPVVNETLHLRVTDKIHKAHPNDSGRRVALPMQSLNLPTTT